MGCIWTKERQLSPRPEKKIYSWDLKPNSEINFDEYLVENITNNEIIRLPGSVNGQQFSIQNCFKTTIMIFDFINSVTVDDCQNCTIILAAVKASVYLRNCTNVTCITSCGQFRTRDCRKCTIFIHCATQAIIESSTSMKFGTFELTYKQLDEHIRQAGLNLSITTWTEIYDFTPVPSETNWNFINTSEAKFTLKARTNRVESILSELNARWLGNQPTSLALETMV